MLFEQRKLALTAHVGLGHSVVAGHSKVLVEKMGPSVVISWGRKGRRGQSAAYTLIHTHTGKTKVFGDVIDIKQPWKDWTCREYGAVRYGWSFGLEEEKILECVIDIYEIDSVNKWLNKCSAEVPWKHIPWQTSYILQTDWYRWQKKLLFQNVILPV